MEKSLAIAVSPTYYDLVQGLAIRITKENGKAISQRQLSNAIAAFLTSELRKPSKAAKLAKLASSAA